METCHPNGRTGSTTGTNGEKSTNSFHGTPSPNSRYRDRISSSMEEEHQPGETLQEFLAQQEMLNGNSRLCSSRSTFRSGSELTSDSDYLEERRNSNPSDCDVFLPMVEPEAHEQKRILEQKKRELPPAHRSWKRVADYVNGLPSIPEPPSSTSQDQKKNTGQAKRQRIWSEVHERRRGFAESSSLSFAEGMMPQKRVTSTSSSNLSMLSSLSSHSSSYAWCESAEDFDKTLLPSADEGPSLHQMQQQQLTSTTPSTTQHKQQIQDDRIDIHHTHLAVRLPYKPTDKAIYRPPAEESSHDVVHSPKEDNTDQQEAPHTPINKDKLLKRRMTNSDLIALASQHRELHTTHGRRQNLFQMGSSNITDSSDTDTSGHSYSRFVFIKYFLSLPIY